ncbi:unnamed protein product [Allacma fusca]|uniref:Exportin-1/Importin-beta-like domain-containing protein n=1 Tax=Allacma fusca TaxID=39272 RepID=A0A8J2L4Q5_9HEXA|nr:unnamed protein product [Allacma fusca]
MSGREALAVLKSLSDAPFTSEKKGTFGEIYVTSDLPHVSSIIAVRSPVKMSTMDDSRRILEACVSEFFAPTTSNDRKRQIEVMLDSFSKQVGAWKQALYFLSTSSNQYVVMFCLGVIENSIKYRWLTSMSHPEQNELKATLHSFLINDTALSTSKIPNFVRNKIIKVITDVGKFAWPYSYPDFFDNVYHMLENNETVIVGLVFLKTISEEWSVIKEEVNTDRKNELKILLVDQVKTIFQSLHRILLSALKQRSAENSSQTYGAGVENDENRHPGACQFNEVIDLALETAAHYCSWIPLDGIIPNLSHAKQKCAPLSIDFIQVLCQLSILNLTDRTHSANQVSSLALGVLNELLYRRFIPKDFDDQLNFMVRFSVELLNQLLSNGKNIPGLCKQYSEKVVQFSCLVARSHFHRLDEATAKAFMANLLPFTFKQEDVSIYYDCLEIWSSLLDHLNAQIPILSLSPSREGFLNQIKHPVMGLANEIIYSNRKFSSCEEDCYNQDDDEESLVPGIGRNIDVLVKIGELFPTESLQSVINTWADSYRFYLGLQVRLNESKTILQVENTNELEHFNFVVHLIGRVANIFYGDVFRNELTVGKSIFHQLVALVFFSRHYIFVKSPQQISQSILELMSALKSWTYWLSRYHIEVILADATVAEQQSFLEILNHICDNVFYVLENRESVDKDIVSVHANFFSTLTTAVRTEYLFQLPSVQALIENIYNLRGSLDAETYRLLHKSVSAILLLPWHNVQDQRWQDRSQMYTSYMKKLSLDLVMETRGAANLILGLNILNDQLYMLSSEGGISKKMCWEVMKEFVPYLQDLSLGYLRLPNICQELLTFFIRIMEVLQQQAGASFFEQAIRNFLNYFSAENIIDDLLKEHENATYVVERFLEMLQYMIKDPSASFKKFLPDALSICYDHIYPIISTRSSPDLKVSFFSLIRDVVIYRWSFFFPGFVLRPNAHANSKISSGSQHQHSHDSHRSQNGPAFNNEKEITIVRINQILQSIGQSFLQSDLEVFRF